MTGIIGTRDFTDLTVGTQHRGAGTVGISEYGGHGAYEIGSRGYAFAEPPSALQRLGTNMLDRLRSTAGMPTSVEVGDAARRLQEARTSPRADQRAAAVYAEGVGDLDDDRIRRLLPEIGRDPLPTQRDVRLAHIATAAIDVMHAHVDHGGAERLSPELGRAARINSLEQVARQDPRAPLGEMLERQTAVDAGHVRNYLHPDTARDAADQDRRKMAEARVGVVNPAVVVKDALEHARSTGRPHDALRGVAVRMPDHRNFRSTPEERQALVAREMAEPSRPAPSTAPETTSHPSNAAAIAAHLSRQTGR